MEDHLQQQWIRPERGSHPRLWGAIMSKVIRGLTILKKGFVKLLEKVRLYFHFNCIEFPKQIPSKFVMKLCENPEEF